MHSRALLIAWPDASWSDLQRLIDRGALPNLEFLVNHGTAYRLNPIAPAEPVCVWTSAVTGQTADVHGVLSPVEPDPASGTSRPVRSTRRIRKAIWNILSQSGFDCAIVNWAASHPAETVRGVSISSEFFACHSQYESPWPVTPLSAFPPELGIELADLRVHPGDLRGEDLCPFIPRLAEIDQETDDRVGRLAGLVAETVSVHAVATELLDTRSPAFTAVLYPAIAAARELARNAPDLYGEVVESSFRFLDMMLGRLMALAGEDVLVVLVSESALFVGGSEVRRDELAFGASILDVVPTLLACFGLPVGRDLPGRVLEEAFTLAPHARYIATWEEERATSSQLRALADTLPFNGRAELNRAHVLFARGDIAGAEAALADVCLHADDPVLHVYLAGARLMLQRFADCESALERATALGASREPVDLIRANLLLAQGRRSDAVALLSDPHEMLPSFLLEYAAARTALILHCIPDAERRFQTLLEQHPTSELLWTGLAETHCRQQRWTDAERAARRAIAHRFDSPEAHYWLGVALASSGQAERAAQAFQTCRRLARGHAGATAALGVVQARCALRNAIQIRAPYEAEWNVCHAALPESFSAGRSPECVVAVDGGSIQGVLSFHDDGLEAFDEIQLNVDTRRRRRGIGSRMLDAVEREACRRKRTRIIVHANGRDPSHAAFLQARRYTLKTRLMTYEADARSRGARLLEVARYARASDKVPDAARIVRLAQAPVDQVAQLIGEYITEMPGLRAEWLHFDPRDPRFGISAVLMTADRVDGLCIASLEGELATIHARLVVPEVRRSWSGAVLMATVAEWCFAAGGSRIRFHTYDTTTDTMYVARRLNAETVAVVEHWSKSLA